MSNPFLPEDFDGVPESPSSYMRFKSGENKIRIVGSAIVGNELWVSGKPVRKTTKEIFTQDELNNADINKFTGKQKTPVYFWAFPVLNYETKKVEILEVTQRKVIEGVEGYLNDPDYGPDPKNYDLVIVRNDESDPVSYSVRAKPPKELPADIQEYVQDEVSGINMKALFEGKDPWGK